MDKSRITLGRDRRTIPILAAVALFAALILTPQSTASAGEEPQGNAATPAATYTSTATHFSSDAQATAEAEVAKFAAANPMPALRPGSSDAEFLEFGKKLEEYWSAVPWTAVFAQWDCKITEGPSVSWVTTGLGQETVALEEAHTCGDNKFAAQAAGTAIPKSQKLRELASTDAGALAIGGCGSFNNVRACLHWVSTGTLRASGTNHINNVILARLRVGQSTSFTSCNWGTFIKYGGNGTWLVGETRSTTFAVSVNANWSNSFQRDAGSGYNSLGTHCEVL